MYKFICTCLGDQQAQKPVLVREAGQGMEKAQPQSLNQPFKRIYKQA
ncbi:hypothetical protein [Halobacillus litoralis]|nr:hypothetical protein [Halobacillus litoralis]